VRPKWRDDPRFLDSLSIEDLNKQGGGLN
jgi:hypothetical protein